VGHPRRARTDATQRATYFYPHPEIYERLRAAVPDPSAVFWEIDSSAIRAGSDGGSIFKYTLKSAPDTRDADVLDELVEIWNPDSVEFDILLHNTYPEGIPVRMQELQILIGKSYKVTKDSSGLYVFKP